MKCRYCKQEIKDESTAYKVGTKSYYCSEEHYKLQNNKDKYKPKKVKTNGEPNDRRELTDYIQKIYVENGYDKHFIPWTMLMSQIKNILQENKKWTCTTIQYILYYMYEVLEMNLFDENNKGSILNLVQFYGLEAEKYYNELTNIENTLENFNMNDNVVIMKKSNKEYNRKKGEIDISKI